MLYKLCSWNGVVNDLKISHQITAGCTPSLLTYLLIILMDYTAAAAHAASYMRKIGIFRVP